MRTTILSDSYKFNAHAPRFSNFSVCVAPSSNLLFKLAFIVRVLAVRRRTGKKNGDAFPPTRISPVGDCASEPRNFHRSSFENPWKSFFFLLSRILYFFSTLNVYRSDSVLQNKNLESIQRVKWIMKNLTKMHFHCRDIFERNYIRCYFAKFKDCIFNYITHLSMEMSFENFVSKIFNFSL